MKTDREFLDGIYAKAERIQAEHKSPAGIRYIWFKKAAPVLVLCLLAVIVLPVYRNLKGKDTTNTDGISKISAYEEIEKNRQMPGDPGNTRTVPFSAVPAESLIVMGEVTETCPADDDTLISLNIEKIYQGTASGTVSFPVPAASGLSFEKGDKGLIYLELTDEGYILSRGDDSWYSYAGEEDVGQVFLSPDGVRISSSELTDQ